MDTDALAVREVPVAPPVANPTLEATQGLILSQYPTHRCHPILVAFVWELTE